MQTIRSMLAGGGPLDSGRVCEIVALIGTQPRKFSPLVECVWDEDVGIASRAADALERLTRDRPARAQRWKEPLLGLMAETTLKKVRWNLALVVPRLKLSLDECRRAAATLRSYLDDKSSIVKTSALHGLADLARQDPASLREVVDLLRVTGRSGTPAMRARSRILLAQLENPAKRNSKRVSLHMFT